MLERLRIIGIVGDEVVEEVWVAREVVAEGVCELFGELAREVHLVEVGRVESEEVEKDATGFIAEAVE